MASSGPAAVDRVQIREEQSQGQAVRLFRLTATLANGTTLVLCPSKTSSIGNKFICVLDAPLTVASVSLSLTGAAAGTTPRITQFAAFRCGHIAEQIDAAWDRGVASAPVFKSDEEEGETFSAHHDVHAAQAPQGTHLRAQPAQPSTVRQTRGDDRQPAAQACSLNGYLKLGDASCVCNPGWRGAACEALRLPDLSAGFASSGSYGRSPNVTSWGATLVQARPALGSRIREGP